MRYEHLQPFVMQFVERKRFNLLILCKECDDDDIDISSSGIIPKKQFSLTIVVELLLQFWKSNDVYVILAKTVSHQNQVSMKECWVKYHE